jgi:FMN-dependent NADH-azoreductase
MKVLHINSSPRGVDSHSLQLAELLLDELQQHKDVKIDRFDLFSDELPPFSELAVGAKMALFTGSEATAEQKQVWAKMREVFDRFASADAYVINIPLWNNGIPYVLKQFVDVVTQPGWAFGFDMEKGYSGLIKNKKACVIHASGVYREGIPLGFGSDFATPYINDWLKFIGVEDIEQIHFAPTVVNPDFNSTKSSVERQAKDIAKRL